MGCFYLVFFVRELAYFLELPEIFLSLDFLDIHLVLLEGLRKVVSHDLNICEVGVVHSISE